MRPAHAGLSMVADVFGLPDKEEVRSSTAQIRPPRPAHRPRASGPEAWPERRAAGPQQTRTPRGFPSPRKVSGPVRNRPAAATVAGELCTQGQAGARVPRCARPGT